MVEVKSLFLRLFFLGGQATIANSEAVLPAYLIVLAVAGVFMHHRMLARLIHTIAFALPTPFFFIKTGAYISLPAPQAWELLIPALLAVKIAAKFIGVWPLTHVFKLSTQEGTYTTLLMSTVLTFGSIAALFGLTHGI